jgi:A/G-specific adenine glycosylase
MLQQTRVKAVLPRYEAFLDRFPDPRALAAADVEEVLAAWSGLGYYRRARSLHAAAREMVDRHDGRVPDDREGLLALPGVGDYTAGAVLSIAFRRPEPVVDGNVERVLSRVFRIRGNVKRGAARRRIRELAEELVREGRPDLVNQALMELGALVCTPRSPRCDGCPLRDRCAGLAAGEVASLPELPPRPATVPVTLAVALARRDGRTLLVRAPEGGLLAGTWAPPFAEVREGDDPARVLAESCRTDHGIRVSAGRRLGTVRHTITHHRIEAVCLEVRVRNADGEGSRWVTKEELGSYGLSSFARKSLRLQFS